MDKSKSLKNYLTIASQQTEDRTAVSKWDDKDNKASENLKDAYYDIVILLTTDNVTKHHQRGYNVRLYIKQASPPSFSSSSEQSDQSYFTIMTDVDSTITSPVVIEGTVPLATASLAKDPRIGSYLELSEMRNATGLFIVRSYKANSSAEKLIGLTDLYYNITLTDGIGLKSKTYVGQIIFDKVVIPSFAEPLPEIYNVTIGTEASFKLPEIITAPFQLRSPDGLIVSIPFIVKNYFTFDEGKKIFFWTDDLEASFLAGSKGLKIDI